MTLMACVLRNDAKKVEFCTPVSVFVAQPTVGSGTLPGVSTAVLLAVGVLASLSDQFPNPPSTYYIGP